MRRVTRRAILGVLAITAVSVVGAGGSNARSRADLFSGTWNVVAAAGTPWASGATLTISPASSSAVGAFVGSTGQIPWDMYIKGYCTGPPSPGATAAKVSAWYTLNGSWKGAGVMGGCVSDKTNGQLIFFGHGSMGSIRGRNGNTLIGHWTANPNSQTDFTATLATGAPTGGQAPAGGTKVIAEPAPGAGVSVASPLELPLAALGVVTVTSSGGDLKRTTVAAPGELLKKAGQLVFDCWLFVDITDEDGNPLPVNAREQFEFCFRLVLQALPTAPRITQASAARASAMHVRPDAGCRAQRLAFVVRTTGKKVSIKPATKPLGPRSVRYRCALNGGTMKITADGRVKGGLRKELGSRLRLLVLRSKTAAKRSGKLTFRFNW